MSNHGPIGEHTEIALVNWIPTHAVHVLSATVYGGHFEN
jgi:hypothetical protein